MTIDKAIHTFHRSGFSLLLLIFVLVLSGCRNDEEQPDDEQQPMHFIGQIKGALNADWRNGDRIGVFAIRSGSTLTPNSIIENNANLPFITSGDAVFRAQIQHIDRPEADSAMDFIAYYPFISGVTEFVPIHIATQTEFLYSNNLRGVSNASTGDYTLIFRQPLARIVINITPKTTEANLANLRAVMHGAKTQAAFYLATGYLSIDNNSVEPVSLTVSNRDNGQKQISMLMLPTADFQNITIEFSTSKESYTWALPEALVAGQTHTFAVGLALEDDIDPDAPIVLYPERPSALYQFWELPVYKRGVRPPNTVELRHKVGDRSWLNQSLPLPDGTIRNFTVLFDTENRLPLWVAYPLHPIYLYTGNRTDEWVTDPLLSAAYQPFLSNRGWRSLTDLQYDRGHVLPSADRNATPQLNATTFFTTNVVVQSGAMNRGVWENLERQVREWSRTNPTDTIYIVSGQILHPTPLFAAADNNGVPSAKPAYMYKALLRRNMHTGTFTSIGFKMENTDNSAPHTQRVVSVAQLEEITGFRFFPRLPASVAEEVKGNVNISAF